MNKLQWWLQSLCEND